MMEKIKFEPITVYLGGIHGVTSISFTEKAEHFVNLNIDFVSECIRDTCIRFVKMLEAFEQGGVVYKIEIIESISESTLGLRYTMREVTEDEEK